MSAPSGRQKQPNAHARERTAAQLQRQERVFALSVLDGRTHREIAKELGLDRGTVARDLRAEAERRSEEIAERREVEHATQLALVDNLFYRSMEMAHTAGAGGLAAAAKALEMRSRLLGLDQAVKLDTGLEGLLKALDAD